MPVSAAKMRLRAWVGMLFVSGAGGGHHSSVLSPTGCPFTQSNDLIIVACLHCLSNVAAACVFSVSMNAACASRVQYHTISVGHDINKSAHPRSISQCRLVSMNTKSYSLNLMLFLTLNLALILTLTLTLTLILIVMSSNKLSWGQVGRGWVCVAFVVYRFHTGYCSEYVCGLAQCCFCYCNFSIMSYIVSLTDMFLPQKFTVKCHKMMSGCFPGRSNTGQKKHRGRSTVWYIGLSVSSYSI